MKRDDTTRDIIIRVKDMKKLYCSKCDFYKNKECSKGRIVRRCLKEHKRNRE